MQLDVDACFAPLLRWVLAWWEGTELTLTIDPTSTGKEPVAQHLKSGGQPGPRMPDVDTLLARLDPVVPPAMTVRVLCDRDLQSPWHPYLRYDRHTTFQATTGIRVA